MKQFIRFVIITVLASAITGIAVFGIVNHARDNYDNSIAVDVKAKIDDLTNQNQTLSTDYNQTVNSLASVSEKTMRIMDELRSINPDDSLLPQIDSNNPLSRYALTNIP